MNLFWIMLSIECVNTLYLLMFVCSVEFRFDESLFLGKFEEEIVSIVSDCVKIYPQATFIGKNKFLKIMSLMQTDGFAQKITMNKRTK